jgi:MarR family transcriptional regulator for hemolysin
MVYRYISLTQLIIIMVGPTIHRSGILQWQAYRALEERLDSALRAQGLSAPEWKTLGVIFDACEEGIRPLQIAALLGVKAPLVTRIIDSLLQKSLVKIVVPPGDGRVRIIYLSAKGEKVFIKSSERVEQEMRSLLQGTKPEEMKVYKDILVRMIKNQKRA